MRVVPSLWIRLELPRVSEDPEAGAKTIDPPICSLDSANHTASRLPPFNTGPAVVFSLVISLLHPYPFPSAQILSTEFSSLFAPTMTEAFPHRPRVSAFDATRCSLRILTSPQPTPPAEPRYRRCHPVGPDVANEH